MPVNKEPSIQMTLFDYFMDTESFTLKEAVECVNNVKNVKETSIRGRIYEGISAGLFKRVSKGVYTVTKKDAKGQESTCMLINGNGKDLSMFSDNIIYAIITDHPYKLDKALKGGNRDFASYDLFKYEQKDFDEKLRVLKPGHFCVEFLPEESEVNFEYLYQVKKMAIESGFKYFAKVPWKKGDWVANTGRTKKNREDIIFFSKGEPRALKLDTKKNKATALENGLDIKGLDSYGLRDLLEEKGLPVSFMKGPAGMLPTEFDYQPRGKTEKVMEAEKPVELFDAILPYITLPGEKVLDQFAGSGNLGVAAVRSGRDAILIEKDEEIFLKMKANVEDSLGVKTIKEKDENTDKADKNIVHNIFDAKTQVIVNPVNLVGVMGAGLAKEMKERYPEMFKKYKLACDKGVFKEGQLQLCKQSDVWILNFPTKRHWKEASDLDLIEKGLQAFVNTYEQKGITSITFPKLGCGLGGLSWDEVGLLMHKYLDPLPIQIEVCGEEFSIQHVSNLEKDNKSLDEKISCASGKVTMFQGTVSHGPQKEEMSH